MNPFDDLTLITPAQPAARRSLQARVVWGQRVVTVGGDAPVRVQSMTNTDTVDVIGTAIQVKELAIAGSELVRITVNTPEAAQAVPHIREQLEQSLALAYIIADKYNRKIIRVPLADLLPKSRQVSAPSADRTHLRGNAFCPGHGIVVYLRD